MSEPVRDVANDRWFCIEHNAVVYVVDDADDEMVATLPGDDCVWEKALLMAAAPDLLRALEGLIGLTVDPAEYSAAFDAAQLAVRKARG